MNIAQEVLSGQQIDFITRFLGVSIPDQPERDHVEDGDGKLLAQLRETAGKRLVEVDAIRKTFSKDAESLNNVFQSIANCDNGADPQEIRTELIDATLRMRALADRSSDLQSLSDSMPVSLSLSALDWQQASDALIGQVQDIQAALAAEIEDPDIGNQVQKLDKLCKAISDHGEVLNARVREVIDSADSAARVSSAGPARDAVGACIAFCEGSPLLAHITNHPLDGADGADAESHLLQPLKILRDELSKIS